MEVCHSFYNTTLMGPLIQVSEATKVRENVLKLLTCWAKSQLGHKIPFTSVNVNKNYASKVDRDKHNLGPSVGLAVGSFTGGHLRYWPNHITSRAPTIQKMCPGISNKILLRNSYSKIAIFVNLSKLPKFRKCALAFSNKILLLNFYSKIAIFVNLRGEESLPELPVFRKCALAFQIRFCY